MALVSTTSTSVITSNTQIVGEISTTLTKTNTQIMSKEEIEAAKAFELREKKRAYKQKCKKCMRCGKLGSEVENTKFKLTIAHIVPRRTEGLDILFGVSSGYIDEIFIEDERNYLVLCGTYGVAGSCHDGYDRLRFSLFYYLPENRYEWINSDGTRNFENTNISPAHQYPEVIGVKYARLLNSRTARMLYTPGVHTIMTPVQRAIFFDQLQDWTEHEQITFFNPIPNINTNINNNINDNINNNINNNINDI